MKKVGKYFVFVNIIIEFCKGKWLKSKENDR
jgi:hypothetical protein